MPALGLRANLPQFALLVVVNAFVGAMVGLERAILPAIAEAEFQLAARTAVLSFILVFGLVKAATNYAAGRFADRLGRKRVLVAGWLIAQPVPFLLMWGPTWAWILWANALLGASQGLTWSATVIMKIDLVGPSRRGLAMGLNEAAGYGALALAALATGYLAASYGLRPQPFYLGVAIAAAGLLLSAVFVADTGGHVREEAARHLPAERTPPARRLAVAHQAGLVNNLNDGLAWGLFPLVFAAAGLGLREIGWLAAVYPAVWSVGQLVFGALSDRWGRTWLIAGGMWVQAAGLVVVALASGFSAFAAGAVLLGLGTAMAYPTLLAAVSDLVHPDRRASAVGAYRFWRDIGYPAGALLSGVTADAFGASAAIGIVAGLTAASGLVVAAGLGRVAGSPGPRNEPAATGP